MGYLISILFVFSVLMPAGSYAKSAPNINCTPKALKEDELKMRERIRPYLATIADQYSGRAKVLAEKEQKRAKMFRQWLLMRCKCEPVGMSTFEKTLCRATTERLHTGHTEECLISNQN